MALPADPLRRSAMLVAILALAGLYFVQSRIHAPRRERAEEASLRIGEIEAYLRAARDRLPGAGEVASAGERNRRYGHHLTQLESLIPATRELPALLESISAEARAAAVTVTLLRPEPPAPGDPYAAWSYRIAARGGYHAIAAFVTAVASLDRIMVPGDLRIRPIPTASDDPAPPLTLLAEFTIHTHVRPGRS